MCDTLRICIFLNNLTIQPTICKILPDNTSKEQIALFTWRWGKAGIFLVRVPEFIQVLSLAFSCVDLGKLFRGTESQVLYKIIISFTSFYKLLNS